MRRASVRVLIAGVGAGVLVAASFAPATAGDVTASSFTNASFELPSIAGAPSGWAEYSSSDATADDITGWTVTSGNVDLVLSPAYPTRDGSQALDLNGNQAGTISKTFVTYPGRTYNILYWVNSNGGGNDWTFTVSGGLNASGPGHYVGDGAHDGEPNYPHQTVNGWEQWGPKGLPATGSSATVTLSSGDTGTGGVLLDDFRVTYSDDGPAVTDLAVSASGAVVHLTGTAATDTPDQGDVTGAYYRLSRGSWNGAWMPMTAVDGAFDEASEALSAYIALPRSVGVYTVCVKALDEAGFYTKTPVCLTNAFSVNVVASGPIVANTGKSATINSASDKGAPDYVVDAVAGMVAGIPVGFVNINYRAMSPIHFLPAGTTPFWTTNYGSIDLQGWHSSAVHAASIQFLTSGALAGYPVGGFWMNFANASDQATYGVPLSTVPSWAPGVPFDRGFVSVLSTIT